MKDRKIFGIGFHKTGTTSLASALRCLDYTVVGPDLDLLSNILNSDFGSIYEYILKYDAFQDNPWPILYKKLDSEFPGSKFILTVREDEKWLNSVLNHFKSTHSDMRKWIYGKGYPLGNEQMYLDTYKAHNRGVREYFKNRSEDFIELSWEGGDGWTKLCQFLDKPAPNIPFPHENRREDLGKKDSKLNKFQSLLGALFSKKKS